MALSRISVGTPIAEDLRVKLLAYKREYCWGSVPAFVIPVMLVVVWGVIIVVLVLVPWMIDRAVGRPRNNMRQ